MRVYAIGAILLPLGLAPATAMASTIRLAFHGWDSAPVGCFEEGSTDTLQLYLPDLLGPVFGPSPYHFGVLSEFGAAFCSGPGGTESDSDCQYDLTLWLEPGNLTIGHVNDRGDQNAALDGEEWLGHRPTDFTTIRVELEQGGPCNTTRTVWIPIEWSLAPPDRVAGPIVAWGDNADLQCNVPPPNDGFVAVACGHNQSLGLRDSGSIDAWGANESGQCDVPTPNSGFVAVAGGNWHSLGLKADGSVIAWGENGSGQCDAPTPVGGFVAIEAGAEHSLGLTVNGSIEAWGANDHGQCNVPSPNSGFVAVGAGHAHSVGLKGDGSVVAWGLNLDHQCEVPSSSTDFIALAVGFYHNLALSRDGSIVAWGSNAHGECEVPEPNADFVAVSAGHWHSVGLKSDGTVVAWGYNVYGQCDVPPPNTEFVGLASGVYHNLGLRHIPTGRCCHLDGSCSITTQPECHSAGDSWNGAETDCDPNPCPMPVGACCLNAFCTQLTADECLGFGGTYQGDGVACVTDICITSAVGSASPVVDRSPRAWPNPSVGATTITFSVLRTGWASIGIYDVTGRRVRLLLVGELAAGQHSLTWDGCNEQGEVVPTGVYLSLVRSGSGVLSCRVVRR